MGYVWYERSRSDLPADDGRFRLDGQSLGRYPVWLTIDGIEIGDATPATSMTDIPGGVPADLTLEDDTGAAIPGRRTITIHLVTAGTRAECDETMRLIGDLNGRTITIEDREWGGHYRGRCAIGQPTPKPHHGAILIDVQIDAEPYLIEPEQRKTLAQGTNQIAVHGNRPTQPKLTLTTNANTAKVSVTDGTRTLTITPATPFRAGQTVTIDTQTHSCAVDGTTTPPDLTSLYPILTPKNTILTITGANGTVTWQPRTLTA